MLYDLIVVGSGSVGAAAGYYATRAGLKVLMIDSAHPPHQQGSHHGSTRLIRHTCGEGAAYIPLVLRAQQLWNELEKISGEQIMHHSGVLNLAPQPSVFIQNTIKHAKEWQLNVQILHAAEIHQRWPQFSVPEGYLGVFEPEAGYLQCEQIVRIWIHLAEKLGCSQLFNCGVSHIERNSDIQKVITAEGEFHARKLLISTGTWVNRLIEQLPIQPVRKIFAWYQADGRYSENNHFPCFTAEMPDGKLFYGFPADNNALKVGRHDGGQPMNQPEDQKPFGHISGDGSEAFSFLRCFLPGTGVCLHGETCSYDLTPDETFIIDTSSDDDNRLIITGLSGHGFKFTSVLGEIASYFAQNKASHFDLSPFSLKRFK